MNLLALFAIIALVVHSTSSQSINQTNFTVAGSSNAPVNPLDQLSSADVASQVAQMTGIYEATAVSNQAQSNDAQLNISSSDNLTLAKTQVVTTALKSGKDIIKYVTQPGDTISSLAIKFGVTSESITASNDLTGYNIAPGQTLYIPPVNGLVYTVKSGDTAQSLASKYGSDANQIISFNDDELTGLVPGQMIVIPNGVLPQSAAASEFAFGYGPIYGYNGYDFGECTWYVATQIPVPANWGNAATWAYYAALSGWHVSSTPTVGAIAQTPYAAGGLGHVGIVVAINGGQVEIRDMNNYGDGGGWDRVGEGWTSVSTFPNYITH